MLKIKLRDDRTEWVALGHIVGVSPDGEGMSILRLSNEKRLFVKGAADDLAPFIGQALAAAVVGRGGGAFDATLDAFTAPRT